MVTCLVTGNLQPIGWGKMAALGLKDLFSQPPFGGFGSDHCSGNTKDSWRDRAELVRIAAKRAQEASPGQIMVSDAVIVGQSRLVSPARFQT